MANLEGMPIGSLPEATSIQDGDEVVVYRPSTGKAYQANTDLIDSLAFQDISGDVQVNSDFITAGQLTKGLLYSNGNMGIFVGYFRINAGSYTTDDTLMTFPIKPPTEIQFPIFKSTGSSWVMMNLSTGGLLRFQSSTTIDSDSYFRPTLVFPNS